MVLSLSLFPGYYTRSIVVLSSAAWAGGYESPHEFLPLLVSPHLNNKLEKSRCGTEYGTVLHALLESRMS